MKSVLFTAAALASVAYAGVVQPAAVDAAMAKSTVTLTATKSVGCSKSVPTDAPNSRCRVTGTLGNPSLITTKKGTLQACQDSCFFYTEHEDDCKTFGYNAKTKTCQLFDKTLPDMDFVAGDGDFVYSNQHCIACAPNPPVSSSKSSSSSSSSSSSEKVSTSSKKTKTKTKSSSTTDDGSSSTTSSTTMPKPTKTKTKTKTKSSSSTDLSSSTTSETSSASSSTSMKPSKTATAIPHDRCPSATVNVAPASQPTATGYVYKRYYAGKGYTENPANPGNRNIQQAPINSTLVGPFGSDCDAITACARQASQASYRYFSFDLHLVASTGDWVCTQYYDPNTNATYFDQKNEDVVAGYGFYNTDY